MLKKRLHTKTIDSRLDAETPDATKLVFEKASTDYLTKALLSSPAFPTVNDRLTAFFLKSGEEVEIIMRHSVIGNPHTQFENVHVGGFPEEFRRMANSSDHKTPPDCPPKK